MASGQPIQIIVVDVLIIAVAVVEYCWRLIGGRALPVVVVVVIIVIVAVVVHLLLLMMRVVHLIVAQSHRVYL